MKKRTSIIIGIVALILDQLTKILFINKNMELIPNVLKIHFLFIFLQRKSHEYYL